MLLTYLSCYQQVKCDFIIFQQSLFNANRTKAELFLPNTDKGEALTKTSEGNWGNNELRLIAWKGYVVQRNGKAVYGGQ